MRIISKFHDYYDSVMKQGVDMSKVFLRETKELDPSILPVDWKKARVNSWGNPTVTDYPELSVGYHRYPLKPYITSIYVVFAGKLYGGFVLHTLKTPYGQHDPHIWTVDALEKADEEYNLNLHEKVRYYARETDYAIACKVLDVKGSDLLLPWATSNSLSIVSIVYDVRRNNKTDRLLIENPCLKDMDFQKVIDPFTAYQELEMYIGGVIGQNPQPADVSDAVKIQQHGFDEWSFRKHKLDNTKERKK